MFLDRDGTINVEKNYVYRIEDFEFIEGAPEAIRKLNDAGFAVIVLSNQSGIARGLYTIKDVLALQQHIKNELRKFRAHIDGFFYCPHHPEGIVEQYKTVCACRKPAIGLVQEAEKRFHITRNGSWMIGDSLSDIRMGVKASLKTILVRTGYGIKTESQLLELSIKTDYIADNLFSAVEWLTATTIHT